MRFRERHPLVVAVLFPWILPVPHQNRLLPQVHVRPLDPADLLLPHGGGDRETDDAPHRNEPAWITFEVLDQLVEFIRRRPPVPLGALSDQAKTAESDASEAHVLGSDLDTVDRRGM